MGFRERIGAAVARAQGGKVPTAGKSDAAIEKVANKHASLIERHTSVLVDTGALTGLLSGPVQSHDTGRTSKLDRAYTPSTTHAERARAMGGTTLADGTPNPTATYPILDGAPVGSVATLAGEAAERVAVLDALLSVGIRPQGLPGSKAERRAARAAKHNAKQRR